MESDPRDDYWDSLTPGERNAYLYFVGILVEFPLNEPEPVTQLTELKRLKTGT